MGKNFPYTTHIWKKKLLTLTDFLNPFLFTLYNTKNISIKRNHICLFYFMKKKKTILYSRNF